MNITCDDCGRHPRDMDDLTRWLVVSADGATALDSSSSVWARWSNAAEVLCEDCDERRMAAFSESRVRS
jgi:hypothetical protein